MAYGAGVGSVPYAMVGEVFTPEYKTLGAAVLLVVRYKLIQSTRKLLRPPYELRKLLLGSSEILSDKIY